MRHEWVEACPDRSRQDTTLPSHINRYQIENCSSSNIDLVAWRKPSIQRRSKASIVTYPSICHLPRRKRQISDALISFYSSSWNICLSCWKWQESMTVYSACWCRPKDVSLPWFGQKTDKGTYFWRSLAKNNEQRLRCLFETINRSTTSIPTWTASSLAFHSTLSRLAN